MYGHEACIHRLPLRRKDVVGHVFKEHCAGCQALLRGTFRPGHLEACHALMQHTNFQTSGGHTRMKAQEDKEHQLPAQKLEKKTVPPQGLQGQSASTSTSSPPSSRPGMRSQAEIGGDMEATRVRREPPTPSMVATENAQPKRRPRGSNGNAIAESGVCDGGGVGGGAHAIYIPGAQWANHCVAQGRAGDVDIEGPLPYDTTHNPPDANRRKSSTGSTPMDINSTTVFYRNRCSVGQNSAVTGSGDETATDHDTTTIHKDDTRTSTTSQE